jgi:hypothetical protein
MKLDEIKDHDLRSWAETYCARKVEDKKRDRTSADSLTGIWKTYNEADWRALRLLPDLRCRAELAFKPDPNDSGPQDVATYVERHLRHYPPIERLQQRYEAPYTMAREANALRALIEEWETPSFPRVTVDWIP